MLLILVSTILVYNPVVACVTTEWRVKQLSLPWGKLHPKLVSLAQVISVPIQP